MVRPRPLRNLLSICGKKNYIEISNLTDHTDKQILTHTHTHTPHARKVTEACLSHGRLSEGDLLKEILE